MTGRPGPLARLGEVAERLDAEALERVRARPRLERAAAQDSCARSGDGVGRFEQLLARLDRARPGHHRQRPVADHRVEDADHRVLGVELARRQLERPADRRDLLDARQRREPARQLRLARPDVADDGDDDPFLTLVVERRHALGEDLALDPEDLGLAGGPGHHDEHRRRWSFLSVKEKEQRSEPLLSRHDPCSRVLGSGNGHAGSSKVEVGIHLRASDGTERRPRCQRARACPAALRGR